ncbi:MAG: phosphodiester glycosidase family protein [Clostridia bacterium]|nr:phosphodiester glycosidase family protein [Clostridia bacterium]
MKKNKLRIFTALILIIFVSFIAFYAGHFLFEEKEAGKPFVLQNSKKSQSPVLHKHISTTIRGLKQDINILEVDLSDDRVSISPVLSFDSIFGYEKLSSMASRKGAYAAVNAGFFYEYGRPGGLVCIGGRLLSGSTGIFPVLMVKQGRAHLSQVKTELWVTSGKKKMMLHSINMPGNAGDSVLYTPEYGKENRVEGKNISVTIKDNIIRDISLFMGSTDIPKDGMLITLFGYTTKDFESFPFAEGDRVEFSYKPDVGSEAYECGSWVVRDGKTVIADRDPWVGTLTNREPRTAVGIKGDGKVVLVTVDGRQPGHSAGMTGRELGEFLVGYGVRSAAMLDGGASTEMIVENKLLNRPSDRGEERLLGGGIIIKLIK